MGSEGGFGLGWEVIEGERRLSFIKGYAFIYKKTAHVFYREQSFKRF